MIDLHVGTTGVRCDFFAKAGTFVTLHPMATLRFDYVFRVI